MEQRVQGILLQEIAYLGRNRILKIFSLEEGLLTLFIKKNALAGFTPFCIAEWVYQMRVNDLGVGLDGSLLDDLHGLRQSYDALMAAGLIAQTLLRSQIPHKRNPAVYELACSYFKKAQGFIKPHILAQSFILKVLLAEGLLALQAECIECGQRATALKNGASVCCMHAAPGGHIFEQEEWKSLFSLTFARTFSVLQNVPFDLKMEGKITRVFASLI